MIKTQSSSSLIVRSNQHDCTINEKLPIFDIYLAILSFTFRSMQIIKQEFLETTLARTTEKIHQVESWKCQGQPVYSYRNPRIPPLSANFKISAFIKSYRSVNCCDNAVKNIPLIAVLCSQIWIVWCPSVV